MKNSGKGILKNQSDKEMQSLYEAVKEAVLQVSNWGFCIVDLKLQKKQLGEAILNKIKFLFHGSREEYSFLSATYIR
ncbi:hypothetical protein SLE2022_348750 [Rubroshorea leprosula]